MSDVPEQVFDVLSLSGDAALGHAVTAAKVIKFVGPFAKKVYDARYERWWKGVVTSKGWDTAQEVQGLIEAKLNDSPEVKETIWAAAKEVLETISDEATEVIGSLS